jgi:hypothetical protein
MLCAYGATGLRLARSFRCTPFPRQPPPTFLRLLERFAFLYHNRKNVANSRNVMCNTPLKLVDKIFEQTIVKKIKNDDN